MTVMSEVSIIAISVMGFTSLFCVNTFVYSHTDAWPHVINKSVVLFQIQGPW